MNRPYGRGSRWESVFLGHHQVQSTAGTIAPPPQNSALNTSHAETAESPRFDIVSACENFRMNIGRMPRAPGLPPPIEP